MSMERIKADPRWDVLFEVKTHEEFVKRFVPTIYLHPIVNEEIRRIFISIQRKLVASYFDYETIDDAAHKAVFTLEMALKLRYQELHNKRWSKRHNFQDLLDHFQKEGFFEIDNPQFFIWLRKVRNQFAHPEIHSYAGLTSMQFIFIVVDLINDLYEDRDLRKLRSSATENYNTILTDYAEKGAKIQFASGEQIIFYRCLVGFINNAVSPNIITLLFKPTFPIPKESKPTDSLLLYSWETIVCNDLNVLSDKLVGLDESGNEVFCISKLQGLEATGSWNVWKSEFDAYRQVMPVFDIPDFNDAGEKYAILKKAFHERDVDASMI